MKIGKFDIPIFPFLKTPEEETEETSVKEQNIEKSEAKVTDKSPESADEKKADEKPADGKKADEKTEETSVEEEKTAKTDEKPKEKANAFFSFGSKKRDTSDSEEDEDDDEVTEEELQDQEEVEEIESQLAKLRGKFRGLIQNNRLVVLIGGVICLAVLLYFLIHTQTYTNVSVLDTKSIHGAINCSYTEFQDGFLKYSQDGLAYIASDGSDKWNQAYQLANPFVEINGKIGVVADKQGNGIYVFQKSGVIGQMETTMPIERVAVSKQGIVCAILRGDDTAMVLCYDSVGNILVEHKTSFGGTGYPLDVALSSDGQTMLVTYLYVAEGVITTKVMFYNFGAAGENKADHQVASFEYPGTISGSCFFMDDDISVVVGDNKLIYYSGTEEPKEEHLVELDSEIKNLCHTDDQIGLVMKNSKEGGYEARLYNSSGKMTMSTAFTGEYNNVKICDGQILMYDGRQCSVILDNGVIKFKGEMENAILEITPENGVNKYLLVDQDGLKKIRLVK